MKSITHNPAFTTCLMRNWAVAFTCPVGNSNNRLFYGYEIGKKQQHKQSIPLALYTQRYKLR
ncbi:MAG TPA: hypothetical protein PK239_10710 [Chitinophagales bacterium]|nr:hypothetical protein [Chitinophagales bacterium]HRK27737.1 hypothetical protein [Chitinophagales bacterium]